MYCVNCLFRMFRDKSKGNRPSCNVGCVQCLNNFASVDFDTSGLEAHEAMSLARKGQIFSRRCIAKCLIAFRHLK